MSIKINHLTHIYGAGTAFEKKALDDINLEIKDGEFIGLIGHTGSGKSTLTQHLNALLVPTSGEVLLNGENIYADKSKLKSIRQRVGLVFQYPEHQLFEMTVYKDVAYGPGNLGLSQEEIDMKECARHSRLSALEKIFTINLHLSFREARKEGPRSTPASWRWSRRCSYWMNPRPDLIQRAGTKYSRLSEKCTKCGK